MVYFIINVVVAGRESISYIIIIFTIPSHINRVLCVEIKQGVVISKGLSSVQLNFFAIACLSNYDQYYFIAFHHISDDVAHAQAEYVDNEAGSQISYTCDDGWELEGIGSQECTDDGTWTTAPSCISTSKFYVQENDSILVIATK